ncbi:hypothetical protein B0H14DRAFT_2688588 [Mycena olivaceomarginata]|nr:hypothetical protein B0H14DRAFT_2688588 [Mycena olivaceomarginata]
MPNEDFHYEPLRASVLDVFEQLGAFDDQSGIVDWIFPDFHEQKELSQRTRVKLTEVFDAPEEPEPEPETPRKTRTARFFRLGTKSRSKSRGRKEAKEELPAASKKPKKASSSPNLRKDAAEEEIPAVPPVSSPVKQDTAAAPAEHKSRRLSLFPRKAAATSLDQPRPSISDEEWQQITITGSIADYDDNPFLGRDPHATHDAGPVKRDGRQKYFSRFASSFTRSTPSSPTREHSVSQSSTAPTSPTRAHPPSPLSIPARAPQVASPQTTNDPTTPTGPYPSEPSPLVPTPNSPTGSAHSNASTSTLPAVPPEARALPREGEDVPASAEDTPEVPTEDPDESHLETTSQMDHVRTSLSDITESDGEQSEGSTAAPSEHRKSQASEEGPPEEAS